MYLNHVHLLVPLYPPQLCSMPPKEPPKIVTTKQYKTTTSLLCLSNTSSSILVALGAVVYHAIPFCPVSSSHKMFAAMNRWSGSWLPIITAPLKLLRSSVAPVIEILQLLFCRTSPCTCSSGPQIREIMGWASPAELVSLGHQDCPTQMGGGTSSQKPMSPRPALPCLQ